MGIFSRVTQGDLDEIKHAVELLSTRVERLQKGAKAATGREAGMYRRLKALEDLFKSAVPTDNGLSFEPPLDAEEEESIEEQRIRLGRG